MTGRHDGPIGAAALQFAPYTPAERQACLALLAANTPASFDPGEMDAYSAFIDAVPSWYQVAMVGGVLVGAWGLQPTGDRAWALHWIMVAPGTRGTGIGSAMMRSAVAQVEAAGGGFIQIAASHVSRPFFARHGATVGAVTPDGWGPGMHRVDMHLVVPHGRDTAFIDSPGLTA